MALTSFKQPTEIKVLVAQLVTELAGVPSVFNADSENESTILYNHGLLLKKVFYQWVDMFQLVSCRAKVTPSHSSEILMTLLNIIRMYVHKVKIFYKFMSMLHCIAILNRRHWRGRPIYWSTMTTASFTALSCRVIKLAVLMWSTIVTIDHNCHNSQWCPCGRMASQNTSAN